MTTEKQDQKSQPTKPKKRSNAELKADVKRLGGCVLWALKFLDAKGGGALVCTADMKKCLPWEDDFMDALDSIGYVIACLSG
jgi:hypothetical protein